MAQAKDDESVREELVGRGMRLKSAADQIFHCVDTGEDVSKSSAVSYHEAISMYQEAIRIFQTDPNQVSRVVSCKLSVALSFAKLDEWAHCVTHCNDVVSIIGTLNEDTYPLDMIRARYMALFALLRQRKIPESHTVTSTVSAGNGNGECTQHAHALRRLIQQHRSAISDKDMSDYEYVLRQVGVDLTASCSAAERMHVPTAGEPLQPATAGGNWKHAAEELLQCAVRTGPTDRNAQFQLLQAAQTFLHARLFLRAVECTERILHSTAADSSSVLVTTLARCIAAECAVHLKSSDSSAADSLQQAVADLEVCVFERDFGLDGAKEGAWALHLTSPERQRLIPALLRSGTAGITPNIETQLIVEAVVSRLLEYYDLLVEVLGRSGRWEQCNEVIDRCIDVCNALLLQPAAGTEQQTGGGECGDLSQELVNVLRCRRARSFCSKALICKDQPTVAHIFLTPTVSTPSSGVYSWKISLLAAGRARHSSISRRGEGDSYCTFHKLRYDSIPEAVAIFLQVAGSEYEESDLSESLKTSHILASYTMQMAGIEAFQLDEPISAGTKEGSSTDLVDRRDLAEKAVEAWKKTSLLANRKLGDLNTSLNTCTDPARLKTLSFEKYYFLQQAMLALYNAGVCGFHCGGDADQSPAQLAQRCLESAEAVRADIDKLLSSEAMAGEFQVSATPRCQPTRAATDASTAEATSSLQQEERSLHGYYSACGDLAYHLAQAYLRLNQYSEMLRSSDSAVRLYQHSERLLFLLSAQCQEADFALGELELPLREMSAVGRGRLRQATGLVALAHSALGEERRSQQMLRKVGDLCLGPIEDAEREMAAVQALMARRRQQALSDMRTSSTVPVVPARSNQAPPSSSPARPKDKQHQQQESAGISNFRAEAVPAAAATAIESVVGGKQRRDYNLLVAYFVLGSFAAFLLSVLFASYLPF